MTLFYLHLENGWMDTSLNFLIVRSPAFYVVVGWLWGMSSKRRTIKEHWLKRKESLVIPYLWFSLIFIVLDLIFLSCNVIPVQILLRDIYKTLCLKGIGTLWFLPALLGGEVLFLFVRDKSWRLKLFVYISCFSIICYYTYWYNHAEYAFQNLKDIINAPFHVLMDVSNAFIYISTAFYFSARYGKRLFDGNKLNLFVIGVIAYGASFYLFNFTSFQFVVGQLVLIVGSFIIGVGVLLFFRSIETFQLIAQPLVYFGKNSLIVMTMHWALFLIAMVFDRSVFHYNEYSGFRTVIYFLISLVLMIGIIELINRKFQFIIGK